MALVAYDASDESCSENEDDSIFKSLPTPKVQTNFAENAVEAPVISICNAKYNTPSEKKRAKITVPSLAEFPEEDSEPSGKKAKQFKCGLFSVLPPPQHATRKEGNRTLIPHTLTRRQNKPNTVANANSKPLKTSTATITKQTAVAQSSVTSHTLRDSDEEEDGQVPTDFFSLSETQAAPNTLPELEPVPLPLLENEILSLNQDVPQLAIVGNPSTSYPETVMTAHPTVTDELANSEEEVQPSQSGIDGGLGETSSWVPMNDADILQDEGFLRLQGKRAKGGRVKDDITIIDVSQDDQLPSAAERQSKALTQETEYRPRRKGGAPTSQQRRKHQITYLAFQAREREYELKNQWAENRMTRKQTQSKYGF